VIIPAVQEAETEGLQFEARLGKKLVRLYLTRKKKKKSGVVVQSCDFSYLRYGGRRIIV
jgi:hypothetical protein